jgi:hypothetical protein
MTGTLSPNPSRRTGTSRTPADGGGAVVVPSPAALLQVVLDAGARLGVHAFNLHRPARRVAHRRRKIGT